MALEEVCSLLSSVSDYVQMDVFTSAESAKYVEILGQANVQNSQSYILSSSVGHNAWQQQHSSDEKAFRETQTLRARHSPPIDA